MANSFQDSVFLHIQDTKETSFRVLSTEMKQNLDRDLSTAENRAINKAIHIYKSQTRSELAVDSEKDKGDLQFVVVTAYTDNYQVGKICEEVNRQYAAFHGYEFVSRVTTYKHMMEVLHPKSNAAWYKILYFLELFEEFGARADQPETYFVWIDADALVVDNSIKLEDIARRAKKRELIIAEDVSICCPVNAGVFLLKYCEWSKTFLQEVWTCDKYDKVSFFEQSAIIRYLKLQGEGLNVLYKPFHSYIPGAFQGDKLFEHVAVLPHWALNSNRGITREELKGYNFLEIGDEDDLDFECFSSNGADTDATLCDGDKQIFLFHPAGAKNKILYIIASVYKYDIEMTKVLRQSIADTGISLRLSVDM